MGGLHRTVWYELQARDWPFKNQAAEALIWQIGSGEGMKRVLASVSLGKEVTVSSRLLLLGEGRGARGPGVGTGLGALWSLPRSGAEAPVGQAGLLAADGREGLCLSAPQLTLFFNNNKKLSLEKDWKEIKIMVLTELEVGKIVKLCMLGGKIF